MTERARSPPLVHQEEVLEYSDDEKSVECDEEMLGEYTATGDYFPGRYVYYTYCNFCILCSIHWAILSWVECYTIYTIMQKTNDPYTFYHLADVTFISTKQAPPRQAAMSQCCIRVCCYYSIDTMSQCCI